jgi:D-alanine-D-alanine ligase
MKRLRVAVLMGGKSAEHEISMSSGREVIRHLDPKKYDAFPIIVSREGTSFQLNNRFPRPKSRGSLFLAQNSPHLRPEERRFFAPNKKYSLGQLSTVNCQLFFIAMHGPYGEDGTIQGFLELIGVLHTGSGVLASALGMDKISSRKLFTQAGLKTPKYLVLKKNDNPKIIWQKFQLPFFIKPHNQGSSVGTTKITKKEHLKPALDLASSFSNLVLVEEFIEGTEITCPVIGNEKLRALPIVEVIPKREFFDYQAKYNESLCDEIVPARISKQLTKKAQKAASTAFRALGCRGFGRIDMIIKGNDVYVLELNTIPGLTPVSLVPKAAQAAGIAYPQLLDKIINLALENN